MRARQNKLSCPQGLPPDAMSCKLVGPALYYILRQGIVKPIYNVTVSKFHFNRGAEHPLLTSLEIAGSSPAMLAVPAHWQALPLPLLTMDMIDVSRHFKLQFDCFPIPIGLVQAWQSFRACSGLCFSLEV